MRMEHLNGLHNSLSTLAYVLDAQSRSISSENRNGAKSGGALDSPGRDENGIPVGPARGLGKGWKVHPSDVILPGETFVLADIEGPGSIQHIWMTPTGDYRKSILRIFYDDQITPSVESPVGDLLASVYQASRCLSSSLASCMC